MTESLRSTVTGKRRWRSERDDVVSDFYVPLLGTAQLYGRAVGYFRASALAAIADGLASIVNSGATMELICSPHLARQDRADLMEAYESDRRGDGPLARELLTDMTAHDRQRLKWLAFLIEHRILDVKLAVRRHPDGSRSLYHEKLGLIVDQAGDFVAWGGSPNESHSAFFRNAESFNLLASWDEGLAGELANEMRQDFVTAWDGTRPGIETLPFPEAVIERWLETFPPAEPPVQGVRTTQVSGAVSRFAPSRPDAVESLFAYQAEAIDQWFVERCGTLAMATGTGKTVTALEIITRFAHEIFEPMRQPGELLPVFVLLPDKDLASQWQREAARYGIPSVICNSDNPDWHRDLVRVREEASSRSLVYGAMVTAGTLKASFKQLWGDTTLLPAIVVGDEMHTYGTLASLAALPPRESVFPIGLSATPDRPFDQTGTHALLTYFGEVIASIEIGDAIDAGALCPYYYIPIANELDEAEASDYLAHAASWESADGPTFSDLRRAALLGHAREKLMSLRRLLTDRPPFGVFSDIIASNEAWSDEPLRDQSHILFYCAEGRHPLYQDNQVENVMGLLDELGIENRPYTESTSSADRRIFTREFQNGKIRALVSMRCLDEGWDVPEATHAVILASTTNRRQFVQRRGRVLRQARTTARRKRAFIYDFVAMPGAPMLGKKAANSMLEREQARADEMARFADNGSRALAAMRRSTERFVATASQTS